MARKHGWVLYRNGFCRCDVCRAEHARKLKEEHNSRKERLTADPTLRPHGVTNTYDNWGCRCIECSVAWSRYLQQKRQRSLAKRWTI